MIPWRSASFGGMQGLDLPSRKARTRKLAIESAALPPRLLMPLRRYGGGRAEIRVQIGQQIRGGEVIAVDAADVPLHAPTSGRVRAFVETPEPCLEIEVDGDDLMLEPSPLAGGLDAPPEAIRACLRAAGLVGLGGAGFPTATKLAAARGVDCLIINAAECEPYLTADERLLAERSPEVLAGVRALAQATGARRVVVAVEDDKSEAITALQTAADDDIELHLLPRIYPSGSERQLAALVTGREVPSGQLPLAIGVLCQSVATAWAAGRAVFAGEPVTRRIVTVAGAAIDRPGNLEVRLGTPVGELLRERGLDPSALAELRLGGPLTGRIVRDHAAPIGATTAAVLALAGAEAVGSEPEQPCIRCGACAEVCPAWLQPQLLHQLIRAGDAEGAGAAHLGDCIECAACVWVCPSRIPLLDDYRAGKHELARRDAARREAERARLRHERRQARMEREREAAAAARKARLARVNAAVARARSRTSES